MTFGAKAPYLARVGLIDVDHTRARNVASQTTFGGVDRSARGAARLTLFGSSLGCDPTREGASRIVHERDRCCGGHSPVMRGENRFFRPPGLRQCWGLGAET